MRILMKETIRIFGPRNKNTALESWRIGLSDNFLDTGLYSASRTYTAGTLPPHRTGDFLALDHAALHNERYSR